jgi:hypothetical protein
VLLERFALLVQTRRHHSLMLDADLCKLGHGLFFCLHRCLELGGVLLGGRALGGGHGGRGLLPDACDSSGVFAPQLFDLGLMRRRCGCQFRVHLLVQPALDGPSLGTLLERRKRLM